MNRDRYDKFVSTFFDCDPQALTEIFQEFVNALRSESALPPGRSLSQNYDTAKANPEIHMLPGNLKDARDAVFPYFWGTDSWASPLHLENVKGPANYASLVGAIACLLKNPNLCTDTYSQRSNELEVKAVTALANLIFYHTVDPWGVFTIGGTVSNLYGAKIGIEQVIPGAMRTGLGSHKLAGIVSQSGHYSNQTLAGWLGLGTENLHAIPTDGALSMRIDLLEEKVHELYSEGVKLAFVVATFGSTDAGGIDDIAAIREVIDRKANEFGVPVPQLHVDAAVGWALCFLTEYDLDRNPLEFRPRLREIVRAVRNPARAIELADSVTMDFHKMGRGHYPGSAILLNHKSDLRYLARSVTDTPYFAEADERRDPALVTLECSRPAIGPYSVMASLNGIGLTGWQMLTARSLELAEALKERIDALEQCKVLNRDSHGPSVCWWVLPKGRDAKAIFDRLERGELTEMESKRYFNEVRRLFEKRAVAMDPTLDARLSFTTNYGYRPHGIEVPAWKAVLFNPKTDEAVLDRVIYGIEEYC